MSPSIQTPPPPSNAAANRRPAEERERVERASDFYLNQQLELDEWLVQFRYETHRPLLRGPRGLELGCGLGEMTRLLLRDLRELTVVDAAAELLASIPDAPNLVKVHALFEEYEPAHRFDSILLEHVLEHVEDPVALLRRDGRWLAPAGRLHLGVPNGHSIHRLAAVEMGLLDHPCQLNPRDRELGHRRVYEPASFRRDLEAAGYRIEQVGGCFLKPLSNQQIEDGWTEEMIRAFFELGKQFPDNAAELFAVCALPG